MSAGEIAMTIMFILSLGLGILMCMAGAIFFFGGLLYDWLTRPR